jgi:hypothetical protein
MQANQESNKVLNRSHGVGRRTGWFRRLCTDIFYVAKRDRTWWMLPLILLVLAVAGLLAFVTLAGPLAPFIYPLL